MLAVVMIRLAIKIGDERIRRVGTGGSGERNVELAYGGGNRSLVGRVVIEVRSRVTCRVDPRSTQLHLEKRDEMEEVKTPGSTNIDASEQRKGIKRNQMRTGNAVRAAKAADKS